MVIFENEGLTIKMNFHLRVHTHTQKRENDECKYYKYRITKLMVKLYETFLPEKQKESLSQEEKSHLLTTTTKLISSHAQNIFYKEKLTKRKDINFGLNSILIRVKI
jgi:hypothetical protein